MPQPIIIMAGTPAWGETVIARLSAEYQILQIAQPGSYMKTLIEQRVAAVLIDGTAPDWDKWTSIPKSSPATRRIPLLLISDDADTRAQASKQGADMALAIADLLANPLAVIAPIARVLTPEYLAELDCQCQEALPPLAIEGVAKFNAGEYYAQHDLFEEQWATMTTPVRDLYRAILQVGVAYFQIQRGNYRGALKMLQRSVQWLVILPDVCQGVDVKQLRDDSFAVRAELERLGETHFADFDQTLIKPLVLIKS